MRGYDKEKKKFKFFSYPISEGGISLSGQVPIATCGGLKARGHPVGASGVYQAVEAAGHINKGICYVCVCVCVCAHVKSGGVRFFRFFSHSLISIRIFSQSSAYLSNPPLIPPLIFSTPRLFRISPFLFCFSIPLTSHRRHLRQRWLTPSHCQ